MIEKKIKVVWLCHFMNRSLSEQVPKQMPFIERIIRKIQKRQRHDEILEYGIWVTNAIHEFENNKEFEIHLVCPQEYLRFKYVQFEKNGTFYHFFCDARTTTYGFLKRMLFHDNLYNYKSNHRTILKIIHEIEPDIVHVIGAESPNYSNAIVKLPPNIPVITQLQTLINDPEFKDNFFFTDTEYQIRADCEIQTLKRTNYIGTTAEKFIRIIKDNILPDAIILNTSLALTEPINAESIEQKYDFVYFALQINKAVDWAIEAFALANQKHPNITLDIVGGYEPSFRRKLEERIERLAISNQVFFEGKLPTHEDVIHQIKKSRFALLPLKIDLISGTIREAMANGLPVVTTITPNTPCLNSKCQCVLLSEKGDIQAMADNMTALLSDDCLAERLRENAYKTISERKSNHDIIQHWKEAYNVIIRHFHEGVSIPEDFLVK